MTNFGTKNGWEEDEIDLQRKIDHMKQVVKDFLYKPLPGIALPEKYEHPYTTSQESWNLRLSWLEDLLKDAKD